MAKYSSKPLVRATMQQYMSNDNSTPQNPGGRPTKYKPEYCQQLIAHMKSGMSFESFGAIPEVCADTLYHWCTIHPEFSEAKKLGKVYELRFWETIARHSAMGMNLKIGNETMRPKESNPTLIIFTMKCKFPKLYRDHLKVDAEINVTDKTFDDLPNDEKAVILKAALDAKLKKIEQNNIEDEGK